MSSLKILCLSIVALALVSLSSPRARADVLGQHHPGMTQQQPHHPPANPTQIKHKRVISVTTYVRNAAGVERTVTWDFTTHVWNGSAWAPVQWGASYIRAIQGLHAQGWNAYNARSHNARTVTGTW